MKLNDMKLSPRKARSDQFIKLNSDNMSTENYWILLNEHDITLCEQSLGESPKNQIHIKKRQFNKIIDWYNREQKINSK